MGNLFTLKTISNLNYLIFFIFFNGCISEPRELHPDLINGSNKINREKRVMTEIICPKCFGDGRVWHFENTPRMNERYIVTGVPRGREKVYKTCRNCNGTGRVRKDYF